MSRNHAFNEELILGTCPCCKDTVHEFRTFFACRSGVWVRRREPTCKFKVSKRIRGRTIDLTHLEQLLTHGKTEIIKGFVANTRKEPSIARLAWDYKLERCVLVPEAPALPSGRQMRLLHSKVVYTRFDNE